MADAGRLFLDVKNERLKGFVLRTGKFGVSTMVLFCLLKHSELSSSEQKYRHSLECDGFEAKVLLRTGFSFIVDDRAVNVDAHLIFESVFCEVI
jgi:hypothetical protein